MNLRRKKKGFTIVELVIVIAVIGVLAAILIPTFVGLVNRANIASDNSLVRDLNNAIAIDATTNGKHNTMQDVLDVTDEYGFNVSRINAKANKSEILWDSANDVFCYFDGNEIKYIPETTLSVKAEDVKNYQYFVIRDVKAQSDISTEYSTYLRSCELTEITTTKGLDVGETTTLTSINYSNDEAEQNVVIRTNGGTLTINAANDTVKHFGDATVLNIEAVDTENCYREFGTVANAQIKKGKIVIESAEAKVKNLLLVAKADKSGFEKIVVETKTGAKLPTFDRTNVNIAENGTLVLNVVTPSTDEYIYLTKAGVIEQIVVTNEAKADVSGETANVASKSAATQAVAKQVANVGTKNEDGNYVDSNGNEIALEDLTSENIVIAEAKANEAAVQTGLTKFSGGAGTEKSPFLIANAEDWNNIGIYSNDMYNRKAYHFKMIADVDVSNTGYHASTDFCGTFDGDGHTLTKGTHHLARYTDGSVTVKNLTINLVMCEYGGFCPIISDMYGTDLTFENVDIITTDDNLSSYTYGYSGYLCKCYGNAENLKFINCNNYASYNIINTGYAGVFVGNYIKDGLNVEFTNCNNYGTVNGVKVSMFIGNANNKTPGTITVANCHNYGNIVGTQSAQLFNTTTGDNNGSFATLNETYANSVGIIGLITKPIFDLNNVSIANRTVSINANNASAQNVLYKTYTGVEIYNSNGTSVGSWYVWIDQTLPVADANTTGFKYINNIILVTEAESNLDFTNVTEKTTNNARYILVENKDGYTAYIDADDLIINETTCRGQSLNPMVYIELQGDDSASISGVNTNANDIK